MEKNNGRLRDQSWGRCKDLDLPLL